MSDPRSSNELSVLKKRLAAIFAVAAACILAGGLAYHHRYQKAIQKNAEELLSSTRHFKTEQILFWRADRINDTNSLLDSPVLSVFLDQLCAAPGDPQLRARISARLQNYLKHNRYRSAMLVWTDGKILVSAGEAPHKLHPEAKALIAKAAASGQVELGDFYPDHDGRPRLDLAARAAAAQGGKKLFLLLETAPEDYLYPLIARWPTKSATGETTLSRQEGGQWLALNEFRLLPGAPLKKSSPLNEDLPAAKAFKGETGTVFGTDYRGKKVMASIGMIPGTGWAIVVKMDWQEIMAEAGGVSALILLFTLFMLISAASLAYMLFRLQEAGYSRSLDQAEAEKDKYKFSFLTLSDRANDMILLADPRERSLLMANQKACEAHGYTEEEMLQLKLDDLIPPENIHLFGTRLKNLVKGSNLIYETTHIKKGGERFPIEVSATGVTQGGRDLVYFICRDIAMRKRLENELREKERKLAGMMYNLPGMAYRCRNDPQWTMEFVSQGCERLTGYKPAELLGSGAIPYNDLILPEDRDRVWREVQTALSADRSFQLIYRIRRKDGRQAVVWEQGSAAGKKDGAVDYLEGLIIDNSEKAAAEEALSESQVIFDKFMEHSPVYVFFKDEKIRAVRLSRNYEAMLGRPLAELLGKSMDDLFPSDLAKSMVADDMRILREGKQIEVEEEFNGREYRTIKFPIDIEGKPRYLAGFTLDVTEQKKAERELLDSKARYKALFSQAVEGILVADLQTKKFLYCNPAICRMLGYTQAELTQLGVPDIHPKEDLPHVLAELEAQAKGEKTTTEVPCLRKDGTVFYASISTSSTTIDGRECALGLFTDITDRKLAKNLLLKEKDRAQTYLDIAGVILVALDADGRISMINRKGAELLDYPQEELIGRNWFELCIPPEQRDAVKQVFAQMMSGEAPVPEAYENRIISRGGGSRTIAWNNRVLREEDGHITGTLSSGEDITERKISQAELAETERGLIKNLRLYTMLAGINQAAAQIKDRARLFERICDICVTTGEFRMAWIGTPDRDTGRVLPLCSAGDTTRYLDSVRISAGEGRDSKGPTGEAAKTGKIIACQDIAADHNMAPWREKAQEAGFASSASIPLYDSGTLTALLSLYSGRKNHFDEDELKMLSTIQSEINLSIEAISTEKKRGLAQAALDRTSQHLADIMDVTPIVLFKLSKMPPGTFAADWVSGNAEAITGYEPAEMLSPDWWMKNLHPDDGPRVMEEQKGLTPQKPLVQDFRFRKKDGTYLWIHSQLNISAAGREIIGSWTDVTYLKESEMHYRELLVRPRRGGSGKNGR